MKTKIKRALTHSACSLAFAAAGAGVMAVGWDQFEITPEPYLPGASTENYDAYAEKLAVISAAQQSTEETTDEDAASTLEQDKRAFVAKTLLDEDLTERQLIKLATSFNTLSAEDGIIFRAFAEEKLSLGKRNECLRVVPENETEQIAVYKMENCMSALISQREPNVKLAAGFGAALGFGFYGTFAFGRRVGRGHPHGKKPAAKP